MIPLDQQRQLIARHGAVSSPYDFVRYNLHTRNLEIVVTPEPSIPLALVRVTQKGLEQGLVWAPLYRSLTVTGIN